MVCHCSLVLSQSSYGAGNPTGRKSAYTVIDSTLFIALLMQIWPVMRHFRLPNDEDFAVDMWTWIAECLLLLCCQLPFKIACAWLTPSDSIGRLVSPAFHDPLTRVPSNLGTEDSAVDPQEFGFVAFRAPFPVTTWLIPSTWIDGWY